MFGACESRINEGPLQSEISRQTAQFAISGATRPARLNNRPVQSSIAKAVGTHLPRHRRFVCNSLQCGPELHCHDYAQRLARVFSPGKLARGGVNGLSGFCFPKIKR
jgi:hypothetical protein